MEELPALSLPPLPPSDSVTLAGSQMVTKVSLKGGVTGLSSACHGACFLKPFHFLDQSWEEDADNRFFFHLLDKSKVTWIQHVMVKG